MQDQFNREINYLPPFGYPALQLCAASILPAGGLSGKPATSKRSFRLRTSSRLVRVLARTGHQQSPPDRRRALAAARPGKDRQPVVSRVDTGHY